MYCIPLCIVILQSTGLAHPLFFAQPPFTDSSDTCPAGLCSPRGSRTHMRTPKRWAA